MTTETIKDNLQALRNIVGADDLLKENNESRAMVQRLKQTIKDNKTAHEKELIKKDAEIATLKAKNRDLEGLTIRYQKKSYSLKEIDCLVKNRSNQEEEARIQDEAQKHYLRDRATLLNREIQNYPFNCSIETRTHIDIIVHEEVDSILYDYKKWSENFKIYFHDEAWKLAESLKDRDYWLDVDLEANNRLESLKQGQWRQYLEEYQSRSLAPFLRDTLQNQIKKLSEMFETICPHCSNINNVTLTPDDLAFLATGGQLKVTCQYCRGYWGPKNYLINLGAVFLSLTKGLQSSQTPPQLIYYKSSIETS